MMIVTKYPLSLCCHGNKTEKKYGEYENKAVNSIAEVNCTRLAGGGIWGVGLTAKL